MPAPGRASLVALASICAIAMTRGASADACGPSIVSSCINDDNFWPHAGPSNFLAVGSSETLGRGQVGFALVTSYLSRPVVLSLPSPGPPGSKAYAIDNQVNGTYLLSYGVTRRLELDFALPITFAQDGSGTAPVTGASSSTALQTTALRDLRFGFAYGLIPRARVDPHVDESGAPILGHLVALTARMEMSAPTGDQQQLAGERTAVWVPSLSADLRHDRLFAGLELGARVRPVTELLGARIGSQVVVALGGGYDILKRELLSLAVEAHALPTLAEQHATQQLSSGILSTPNGKSIAPAEWAVSFRTAPLNGGDLSIQVGGGGSIPLSSDPAITNPRFRFTLGIRYEPIARDSDHDGVLDRDDRCPRVPGVKGGLGGDGCPASIQRGALDLSSITDRCPAEPELVDTFSADACPGTEQPSSSSTPPPSPSPPTPEAPPAGVPSPPPSVPAPEP